MMKNLSSFLTLVSLIFCLTSAGLAQVTVVERPDMGKNAYYVSNRPPLEPSPFLKLPIGSITPKGWVRNMLEIEKDGMTGHLKEISPWLNFATSAWANREGKGERGWEELPYWLKGFGDLGYVLRDEAVVAEARKWIEPVLSSQREDGWIGPRDLLTSLKAKTNPIGVPDLWPNMIMLNVLQSYYEYAGDERVLSLMTKYFKWQNQLPASAFGEGAISDGIYLTSDHNGPQLLEQYQALNRDGVLFKYFPGGDVEKLFQYKDNELHGFVVRYYPNQQVFYRLHFKDGILHGPVQRYYPNGKLAVEMTYRFGFANGVARFYTEQGTLEKVALYSRGKLVRMRGCDAQGTIK